MPSSSRDLPSPSRPRKRAHEYFGDPRFGRDVRHPAAIRRKLRFWHWGTGVNEAFRRSETWMLGVAFQWRRPDLVANVEGQPSVRSERARRPPSATRQRFCFARPVRADPANIDFPAIGAGEDDVPPVGGPDRPPVATRQKAPTRRRTMFEVEHPNIYTAFGSHRKRQALAVRGESWLVILVRLRTERPSRAGRAQPEDRPHGQGRPALVNKGSSLREAEISRDIVSTTRVGRSANVIEDGLSRRSDGQPVHVERSGEQGVPAEEDQMSTGHISGEIAVFHRFPLTGLKGEDRNVAVVRVPA